MRARAIVGKTIARVVQSRHGVGEQSRGVSWSIDAIEFTDGSWLRFTVLDGEGEYGIEGVYPAQPVEGDE